MRGYALDLTDPDSVEALIRRIAGEGPMGVQVHTAAVYLDTDWPSSLFALVSDTTRLR